jgi:hypothetical protein
MNRKVLAALGLALVTIGLTPAVEAGPFHDFFRKVRHAFTQPERSARHHRMTEKNADGTRPKPNAVNSYTERTAITSPPNSANTRTAQGLSSKNSHSVDLPYGTPVPGKKGFVTSPYAPNSGYIDARNFPPGTLVKDPYTGKTFLTP